MKRNNEKASAIAKYKGGRVTLKLEGKKGDLIEVTVRKCTVNYINIDAPSVRHVVVIPAYYSPNGKETKITSAESPAKKVSLPIEDIKVAHDREKNRLMLIVKKGLWESF